MPISPAYHHYELLRVIARAVDVDSGFAYFWSHMDEGPSAMFLRGVDRLQLRMLIRADVDRIVTDPIRGRSFV
jgi:hypothetical protein